MPSHLPRLLLLVTIIGLAACGQDAAEPAAETAPDAVEAAASDVRDVAEAAAPALPRTPSPDGARVYFITPADGATVASPVAVEFGIEGMTVAPAGVEEAASGHHHLVVDAELPDPGLPIPKSANYIHFGDGSTSTSLELAPGEHTLQLILGDHLHIPHDPPVHSGLIRITVE
jgi:hypothetical protein